MRCFPPGRAVSFRDGPDAMIVAPHPPIPKAAQVKTLL